jgi:hypothetical protein
VVAVLVLTVAPDELIVAIDVPYAPARARPFFRKVGTRRAQSISKVVFCGLLRCRALPYAETSRGAAAHAGGQRNCRVHQDLSGAQGGLEVFQGFGLRFEGDGEDNDFGGFAGGFVFGA